MVFAAVAYPAYPAAFPWFADGRAIGNSTTARWRSVAAVPGRRWSWTVAVVIGAVLVMDMRMLGTLGMTRIHVFAALAARS